MAGVKKIDIPNEAKMIEMFWKMIKDFYIPEDTEQYYQDFSDRAREIDKECKSMLGQKLILAYAEFLEEKYKGEHHEYPRKN